MGRIGSLTLESHTSTTGAIDHPRKRLFVVVTLALALGIIELAARGLEFVHTAATDASNPYVKADNPVAVFEATTQGGKPIHRRSPHHNLIYRPQEFPDVKAPNTIRIFLLGGSAAAGWPHNRYTIAALLQEKLRILFPDHQIEVLNVAGGTYASHRVKFVFDEVIEYEPDLILIYSGNNEFLESFVFRSRSLSGPFRHSAAVRIVHRGLSEWLDAPSFDVENYSIADQTSNRVSYAFGKASKYRQNPEQFLLLQDHYRYNIESMIRESKRRGVPVMLLNIPVNLRDWIPNVSTHRPDLSEQERDQWFSLFRTGYLAIERGDFETAVDALKQAAAIDDEYAETHYYLGVAKHQLGEVEEAKTHYVGALIRDAFPFRALPEFQTILYETANAQQVPLIDIISLLEGRSQDGILGMDVLLDYVHLSARSQEAVAHELVIAMHKAGLLPEPLAIPIEEARLEVPDEFEDSFSGAGLFDVYGHLFGQFLVMRQYDKLDWVYERLQKLKSDYALEDPRLIERVRRAEHIKAVVDPYRRVLRAEKLGMLRDTFTEEKARSIYANYVEMMRRIEARDMSREEFWKLVPELEFESEKPAGSAH